MPQAVVTVVFALSEGLDHWEAPSGRGPSGLRRLSEPLRLPSATPAAAARYASRAPSGRDQAQSHASSGRGNPFVVPGSGSTSGTTGCSLVSTKRSRALVNNVRGQT